MQRGDWYLERRWPFFLQQTRVFSGWQPCWPSFAVPCPEASGGRGRGRRRDAGSFLHGKAGPWLRYGLAAAGCILLGFGRMKLEIRERVLEEQAAAERGEESLVIEGQVEEIGETDYGYRLMVSDCEEYGPEARRIPRRMYCYTDRADGLKIGMRIRAEGTMEAPEPERNPGGFDHRSFCRAKGIGGIFRADRTAPAGPGYSRFREGSARYGSGWKDVWTSWPPAQTEGSRRQCS